MYWETKFPQVFLGEPSPEERLHGTGQPLLSTGFLPHSGHISRLWAPGGCCMFLCVSLEEVRAVSRGWGSGASCHLICPLCPGAPLYTAQNVVPLDV